MFAICGLPGLSVAYSVFVSSGVKVNPNQYRLFYCYFDPNGVLVISGFVKKTRKTPQHEINKAKHIRAEVLK